MTTPPRVLIVDDDTDLRETLAEVLVESGYDVTSAFDGQDALERLAGDRAIDIILLDLMMPRMDKSRLILPMLNSRPRVSTTRGIPRSERRSRSNTESLVVARSFASA